MRFMRSFPVLAIAAWMAATAPAPEALAQEIQDQAVQATAERTLTPLDVARIETVGEVAIRPDGALIAYTLSVPRIPGEDENGPAWSQLHVVSADGIEDRTYVGGAVNVSQIAWTRDGRFISYLARRDDDDHTSLYVIPADAGESLKVFEYATNIEDYDWRPDGRAIAFVATEPVPAEIEARREMGFNQEIYEEDWRPRRAFVLELPQGPAGDYGPLRELQLPGQPWHVVWDPRGDRLLTDLSPTPLVDDRYMLRRLHVVDPITGEVQARIENPGKLGTFRFSPDGKRVALVSGIDINDPREGRLMVAPATGGALRDALPDLQGHVEDFHFITDDRIVYVAAVGVGSRVGLVRADGRNAETLYEGTDPVFDALSAQPRAQLVALVGERPDRPSELMVLREGGNSTPEPLTEHNPWLASVSLGEQEIVRWQGRDGLEIEGLLIHPLERAPGARVPTLVVVHGGPESHYKNGWLTSYSSPGQTAAGRGYAVLYPNYRGSTGRGVEFAKADQGDGMGAEFDDVLAGVDYLIERGLADAARVGITGGSYGGYATAWGSTRHSERFAAGVMFVGISDQLSKSGTSDIPQEMELVHWLTNPWESPDLMLERSPVMHVRNAQTPLLILHGKEDPRVNPGQSMELYRALKVMTDVPVRLVLYPSEGHGNRRAAARYDYSLRMLRWFDHFLKEGGEGLPPYEIDYGLEPEVSTH